MRTPYFLPASDNFFRYGNAHIVDRGFAEGLFQILIWNFYIKTF